MLATQFIAEGIRQGEPGVVAVFEERPQAYADSHINFRDVLRPSSFHETNRSFYVICCVRSPFLIR